MLSGVMHFDGYEKAFLGYASVWDSNGQRIDRAVYSGPGIAEILVSRDGMDPDDAQEFIDFNVEGAYVGPGTPVVVW